MASRFMVPFGGRSLTGRRDPFMSLHREMNRLFDDTFRTLGEGEEGRAGFSVPQLDVHEGEQEFCVTADLPGVSENDIDLQIEGDMLMLRGEKKRSHERDESGYHIVERSCGAFQRGLRLPFEPDPAKIRADYENGVLTVHVPKEAQQQKSKRIPVGQGGMRPAGQQTIEGSHANDQQQIDHQQAASHHQRGQAGGADDTASAQRQSTEHEQAGQQR
jgi:HSP20 family protein